MTSLLFGLAMISLRMISGPTGLIAYFLIAAYSLRKRENIIQAVFLSWLLTMINPAIAPQVSSDFVGRYLVLASISISAIAHSKPLRSKWSSSTVSTILLGALFTVHSALFSAAPDISLLKSLSWTLAMASLCSAWSNLTSSERNFSENYMFYGLVAVALASVPLVASAAGYSRNETGFQGILGHPQAFGSVMGVLGAWATARLLKSAHLDYPMMSISTLCLAFVLLSESRTAGLSMMTGLALAFFVQKALGRGSLFQQLPLLANPRLWLALLFAATLSIPLLTTIDDLANNFLTKSGRADVSSVFDAYDKSRGELMNAMLDNIELYPLSGIGFGVASDPGSMEVQRDPIFGLAVGAPTEKGVVPLMIAEELGIPIAILCGLWIFGFVRRAAVNGFVYLTIVLVALLVNLGEAVMFSPGGQGPIIMIMIAMGGVNTRMRQRK